MGVNLYAQDIHFSQYYESPVLINPAAAGASNTDFRFAINYKNQWKSVITPFKTLAIAFDTHKYTNKKKKGNHFGYGFTLFNDKAGLSQLITNQVNLDLAYHIYFDRKNSLSVGTKAGFFQRNINTSDLKWDSQFDGKGYDASLPTRENTVYQSLMKFDLGAGLQYKHYNRSNGLLLEIGGAMAHITKPKISFYSKDPSLNYKFSGYLNLQTKLNDDVFFLPSLMYVQQGKHNEFIGGANIKFKIGDHTRDKVILNTFTLISSAIQFGAFYRYKDAVIFMAAMEYKRNVRFGLSYDVNVSNLNLASRRRGGLEFSFVLTGLGNSKTKGNKNDR